MGRTGKCRKVTILWGGLLVIWVSATWGCSNRGEPPPVPGQPPMGATRPTADQINLTDADSGKTVEASLGQTVVISLGGVPSIPGSGWSMDRLDGQSVEQVGEWQFVPDTRSGPSVAGRGGGNFIFKFRAVSAGKSVIRLGHGVDEPDEEFTVTLDVKGGRATQPASRPATEPAGSRVGWAGS